MKFGLTYLTALTLLVASCTSDEMSNNNNGTLSGDGNKTPLNISAALSDAAATSRAGEESSSTASTGFAQNAELLVYLRHTTGDTKGSYTPVTADKAPCLVSLKCNDAGETVTDFTAKIGDTETKLYWDDFSNSASADTDLRTEGHGLQAYYGYCYNGGAPNVALTNTTGVLGWTVPTEQSSTEILTKNDLLWSAEQATVTYAHADKNEGGDHNTITIPFTHAMSKVTVNVILGEGYSDAAALTSTKTSISGFNIEGTFNAPKADDEVKNITGTIAGNISMYGAPAETTTGTSPQTSRTFTAMTVPHTNLTVGNTLATITDVAGNNYNIPVTDAILQAWKGQLKETEEELDNGMAQAKGQSPTPTLLGEGVGISRAANIEQGKGYITKPGVNYVLNVKIAKTKITVSATLKDWDYVYADAVGQIQFANDVTTKGEIAAELQAKGFDVYKNTENSSFTTKSTTVKYADGKWSYDPVIYWKDKDDNEYFRALSPAGTSASTLNQGTDYLWGTSGDEAVAPRTGDVPLEFSHAMSKITMSLETSSDASKVDLTGAKIEISNLVTTGCINMVTGALTAGSTVTTDAIAQQAAPISGLAVIPQTISDDAIITITLADGTTYKLKLKDCVDSASEEETKPAITAWAQGKHYTYSIHLEKEGITFRAMIKDWDEKTGSGNANLEWD